MRYSIDHVLEGIAIHRGEQVLTLQAGLQGANEKLGELIQHRSEAPGKLVELLRHHAELANQQPRVERDDFQAVHDAVRRLERDTTKEYDVDNQARKVAQLQQDLDQLPAVGTTRLEQFLKALQAGGETHVSQHSLKQAGFAVEHLVTVILARAAAQGGKA